LSRAAWSFRRWLLAVCLCALGSPGLSACTQGDPTVAVGREFPMERSVAVKKGSSKREVEDLLGPPWRVTKLDERREQWRYYARIEVPQRILYVIPNRTDIKEQELTLIFVGNFVDIIDKNTNNYAEE